MGVPSHQVPGRAALMAQVERETGLSDYGDPWFFANIDVLIGALNTEAQLTEAGLAGATGMIVQALTNRLRHVDLVKRHPEILDEKVDVAAVVVGLPRTGSTMLHRMLASAPGMTGVRWFEGHNYAPFPGEARGEFHKRLAWGEGLLKQMLEAIPDLLSIHPMSVDQPDEELLTMGLLFSGTFIEGMYYVPSFGDWLIEHSRTRCYADLKEILQSLQWQDPSRRGKRWVLKTPSHLLAVDAVAETFPDALIVMTHRDPVSTVASYASMEEHLYSMASTVDGRSIGAHWASRLQQMLSLFTEMRAKIDPDRFIDVRYTEQTAHPAEVGKRVLRRAGVEITPEIEAGMAEWIEANRREDRAPHRYALEDFNLTAAQMERAFADYREKYILNADATR